MNEFLMRVISGVVLTLDIRDTAAAAVLHCCDASPS